jgi:transcriptional regulator with XRE-family HTH domain
VQLVSKKKKGARLKHPPHLKVKGFFVANAIRQKEVADILNIAPTTLNQKLNGYLHFTFDEVEKICDEYGVSPEIFLTRDIEQ